MNFLALYFAATWALATLIGVVGAITGTDPAGLIAGGIGAAILGGIGVQVFRTSRQQSTTYDAIINGLREQNKDLREENAQLRKVIQDRLLLDLEEARDERRNP